MRTPNIAIAALVPACLLAVPGAHGAEMQQPVPLYTAGLLDNASPDATNPPGSSGACSSLPPTGPVSPGQIVVRNTDRPDVGPYTVTLPGYGMGAQPGDQQFYRPLVATVPAGGSLRFDMVNQLDAGVPDTGEPTSALNLHTHGLIVSPRPCTPLGDYVFVEDQPGTTTSYRMDIPPTLPGYMFGSQTTPRPYPSGLSWFHAHLHMQSQDDVMAGQAGMLYIGDLRADLLAAPNLDPATAATLDNADVLYLGLRDIQLAVPSGATPDRAAPGQRASWIHGDDYNSSSTCQSFANPPVPVPGQFIGPGYCGHRGATLGGQTDPNQDTVWLFTVNGQHNPTVTMQPGRSQIWRIGNMSSNVTYVVELTNDATGQQHAMTALAFDGVVSGTSASGDNNLQVGIAQRRILLMPGNRVEVLVANDGGAAGQNLTLRTMGITTGSGADAWPRIDLAHVVLPPGANAGSAPFNVVLPMAAPTPVVPTGAPASTAAPVNCVTLPPGQATRRRITFTNTGSSTEYFLQSEVVDIYGRVVDANDTIPAQPFPMQAAIAPDVVPHICPRLGEQEVWEILNASGQLHNFHIHQNKFRLTQPSDSGAPPNLQAFQDPASMVAQYIPEMQYASPSRTVDIWRDTIALAPYGGRVFVTIPFYAPQQVGNFVYHCHILRHEDRGMMSIVQVFDPSQLASSSASSQFASLLESSICGLPPAPPHKSAGLGGWMKDAAQSVIP